MKRIIFSLTCLVLFGAGCSRFHNAPATSQGERYVVISPIYNEIIWALGAQDTVVGIDLSTNSDHPRVAVIHFGRASNVYLVVGKGGGGDGGGVSQMVELAGGQMAVESQRMQRMESPEIIAKANPDVILITDYGYDRLGGSVDQIKALPGVATSNAARNNHIYRIEENVLNYFGQRSGENITSRRIEDVFGVRPTFVESGDSGVHLVFGVD